MQHLLLVSALSACGPAVVRGVRPTLAIGTATRTVRELTDLEDARDVVVVGSTVVVATDDGVLVYSGGPEAPTRLSRAEGLPSDDVVALAADADGSILVATSAGLAAIRGGAVEAVTGAPASARVTDLAVMPDGTAWVCSLSGLARRSGSGEAASWVRFGEPFACTTLAPTPEGQLWAGGTTGIFYVDGDTVREHTGGMPERYVRAIVPVLPGQILALLAGPSRSLFAYFDGEAWHGYTLPGAGDELAVGLVGGGDDTFLVLENHVFLVGPSGVGTALRATSSSSATVTSYAATLTPALEVAMPEAVDASEVLRPLQAMASVPTSGPSVRAPTLVARSLDLGVAGLYRALDGGDVAFGAVANGGLVTLGATAGPRYRSRSLVHADDLQIATGDGGEVWVRGRDGDVGKWQDGRLRRLNLPPDLVPQCIATGREGVYLVTLVAGTSNVRVFTTTRSGFTTLVERTLAMPTALESIPFAGVGPDGRIWMGVRAAREDGSGPRAWGAAVIDPSSDRVVYHRRGVDYATTGGLPMPDEVTGMTFDAAGNAWFAALTGAVRVEESQAIVFDETRGVRGDVVTDVAGGSGQMWIAAAEGLGTYADRRFDFIMPEIVASHRPVALAIDGDGHLWAGGRYGLLHFDGTDWSHVDAATGGLPLADVRDVEVDGRDWVWLLGEDRIVVLTNE